MMCSIIPRLYFSKINSILHIPLPHILITKPLHLVISNAAEPILPSYGIVPRNLLRSNYQVQVGKKKAKNNTIKVLDIKEFSQWAEINVAYSLSLDIASCC